MSDYGRRVRELLRRMTLEEKAAQLGSVFAMLYPPHACGGSEECSLPPALAAELAQGIGEISMPCWGKDVEERVRFINAIQKYLRENTRLGIPALVHEEALHGHCAKKATSFPQAVALGCSWDTALVREIFSAVADEVRSCGANHVLSPVLDVAREPRWGRSEECYGEDPFLCARLAAAAIEGLQHGGDLKSGVAATAKHFLGHGCPEGGINAAPAHCSFRTIMETYAPPFEYAVKHAGVAAVMPAYNAVEGVPMHANRYFLRNVLRRKWGFKGVVVSDYNGIEKLGPVHCVAEDDERAAQLALESGVELELPATAAFRHIPKLVREGRLREETVDAAVRRILQLKFRLGLFENRYASAAAALRTVGCEEHVRLAEKAAEKTAVLLKNSGVLPLSAAYRRIAVIGPNAASCHVGVYSVPAERGISILQGMRDCAPPGTELVYAEGCRIVDYPASGDGLINVAEQLLDAERAEKIKPADAAENARLVEEAVAAARGCDAIVLAVGGNESTSREGWKGREGDRAGLALLSAQNELAARLQALGKPLVTVLLHGRPNDIRLLAEKSDALLECWYAGERGGRAIARIQFGGVNPSGKLSVSVPLSEGHLPEYYSKRPSARADIYLFEPNRPLFPFGYGLSYTQFRYSEVYTDKDRYAEGEGIVASVNVKNTGDRYGEEIVQLYIRDECARVALPESLLQGFCRLCLQPGEEKRAEFSIGREQLEYLDETLQKRFDAGSFLIRIGGSSAQYKEKRIVVG